MRPFPLQAEESHSQALGADLECCYSYTFHGELGAFFKLPVLVAPGEM